MRKVIWIREAGHPPVPWPVIDLRLLREDPDRVRASQRARGEDVGLVDALLSADERRRSSSVRFDELRSEQKQLGKLIPKAEGEEKAELLSRTGELSAAVKAADAEQDEAAEETQRLLRQLGNLVHPDVPVGGEEDFTVLETVGAPRDFGAEGFEPKDHLELGQNARRHRRRARRQGVGLALLLPHRRRRAAGAGAGQRGDRAGHRGRLHADADPGAGQAAGHGRHRLPRPGRARTSTTWTRTTSTWSAPPRSRSPAYHMDEIIDAGRLPLRYAAFSPVLPARGGLVRQGHPGHLPRPPVRQGRDVLLRRAGGLRGRAPAAAGVGEAVADRPRAALPGDRCGHRRPGLLRRAQVRLRGVDPDPGQVPRADLHLELHPSSSPAGCPSGCATAST